MISKVSIKNFECLRDVTIELERFTAFVGPNGSGKSSVLRALDLLCQTFGGPGFLDAGQAEKQTSRGATDGVELVAESDGRWYRYRSRAPHGTQPRTTAARESSEDGESWKDWPWAGRAALPRAVAPRLETPKLAHYQPFGDGTAMDASGLGMHSALASMAMNDPDSWQALQADLRRVIGSVRRLRFTKTPPPALLFDTESGDSLEAHQVSEGTLLVLGLLTAFYTGGSNRPGLVLLDDLDRGLHPLAQRDLIALIRGMLEAKKDLQIVATTHSPYLLNWVEQHEVRVTHLVDGSTACAPLTAHPKFERWKDEFSSGEMWSMFGEKWMVEEEVPA